MNIIEFIKRVYLTCLLIIISLNLINAVEIEGSNIGSIYNEKIINDQPQPIEVPNNNLDGFLRENEVADEFILLKHLGASALIILGITQSIGSVSSYNELAKKNISLNSKASTAPTLTQYQAYQSQIKSNKAKMAEYENATSTYNGLIIIGLLWEGWILQLFGNTGKIVSLPYVPDLKITRNIDSHQRNMSMNLHWKF